MTSHKSNRLRSKIWLTFTIGADPGKAICKVCKCTVSRGGHSGETQCTTNLWNHVKVKHPELAEELVQLRKNDEDQKQKMILSLPPPNQNVLIPPGGKAFEIWSLFEKESDSLARCLECDKSVDLGAAGKPTELLWNHVQVEHPNSYSYWGNNKSKQRSAAALICYARGMSRPAHTGGRGKTSSVWTEFTNDPFNRCQVICKTCNTVVKRGTSVDRLNTTNMRRHLHGTYHQRVIKGLKAAKPVPNLDSIELDHHTTDNAEVTAGVEETSESPAGTVSDESSTPQVSKQQKLPPLGSVENVVGSRQVDLVHTAVVMHTLYEQQKKDVCCDFSIFLLKDNNAQQFDEGRSAVCNGDNDILYYESSAGTEFKVHGCVVGATSDKLKTAIEFGSGSVIIKDSDKNTVSRLIEILYTGKLRKISSLQTDELQEIGNVAHVLSAPSVMSYLVRECPNIVGIEDQSLLSESLSTLSPTQVNTQNSSSSDAFNQSDTPPDAAQSSSQDESADASSLTGRVKHWSNGVSENPRERSGTSSRRVNKRKNYMPVSSEFTRKIVKTEPVYVCEDSGFSYESPVVVSVSSQNSSLSSIHESDITVETTRLEKACQACGSPKPNENDKVIKIRKFDKVLTNPYLKVIEAMRFYAFEEIKKLSDSTIYHPDQGMRKKWAELLHPHISPECDEKIKKFYHAAACLSKRCWDLFQEIVDMTDVPDGEVSWFWLIGLQEEAVFSSLIILYRRPYHVALSLIPCGREAGTCSTQVSPVINNKRTQTDDLNVAYE